MPTSAIARSDDNRRAQTSRGRRVHMVGVAGSGMHSLADVLHTAGWEVSGSDLRAGALRGARYRVAHGHCADSIDQSIDLVVASDAVPPHNPELRRARELGVRIASYPQMLGKLMKTRIGVAVAGTHGKSTTTAMASEILAAADLDPTVIYGATPLETCNASRLGRGRLLLAEACEFRENFRYLRPHIAVVLGIELDHVDCFASLAEVEAAFARFVRRIPAAGLVLARADCSATRRAVAQLDCTVETFGCGPEATWQATNLRRRRGYYSFELRRHRRLVCQVTMAVPGVHNVQNALAAAALASHCGATGPAIRRGLARFAGLRRRLEMVAEGGSIAVMDDYAHHPTEVAAALATVRELYPARRLWCVFQPHQTARTSVLLDEFARSLHNADKVVVTEIFRAREESSVPYTAVASDLVRRVAQLGVDAAYLPAPDEIRSHLRNSLEPGDVLVTLGAGDIGAIAHDIGQGLCTIRKAG